MTAFQPLQIANAVLSEARSQGKSLTVMQLLKLVYIAHGWSLALLKAPLVNEEPEAWQHGPVFPAIYREFRRFGSSAVTSLATDLLGEPFHADLAEGQKEVIRSVVTSYGHMHAFSLSRITHQPNTPWSTVYRGGEGSSKDIPDSVIADHYRKLADERQRSA